MAFFSFRRVPAQKTGSPELPTDPRLAYQGPFLNVRPEVGYVGSPACASCHADIARTYAKHPMARSLIPVTEADSLPENSAHHLPFRLAGSRFSIVHQGKEVLHRRTWEDAEHNPLFELDFLVQYVIGSGHHGHSYLSEREGYLFQTPISWYAQKRTWDVSPGLEGTMLLGRPIHDECLYCHADQMSSVPGTINRYSPGAGHRGIGCERCHGPGERHVADPSEYTIVNPAKLDAPLREAVCQQCHLEGEGRVLPRGRVLHDFRPGLPLESCWSVFIDTSPDQDRHAVNHVRQMYSSRCFQKSGPANKLGCISCHDPHRQVPPDARIAFFRARCLACHAEAKPAAGRTACSLDPARRHELNTQDSCIDCHMPRYPAIDVAHQAATDHRILRSRPKEQPRGDVELVHFHLGRAAESDPERARDRAIAMARLLGQRQLPPELLDTALRLLDTACRRCPDDLPACEERSKALALGGRKFEALDCIEAVLAQDPNREISVVMAASLAQALQRKDLAVKYWKNAVALNPECAEYRGRLSMILAGRGNWNEVREQCRAWLRLDPGELEGRQLWILCLLEEGKKEEARAELRRIEHLNPTHLKQLKARLK